jgi:MFS family permease
MALGVLTLGWALGFAIGPGIGGLITEAISWHWIFLINIPIGLMILPLFIKAVPKDEGYSGSLDIAGAALLFSAITCGIYAIQRAPYSDGTLLVVLTSVGCVTFLAAFIVVELKKTDPLLNLRIFKHWKFNSTLVAYMLGNLVYMGMLFLLPFYMFVCMGFSEAKIGLCILISPLLTLIICIPMGRWSDRTQRRSFAVAACGVLMVGCLIMVFFAADSMVLPLVATLLCMGLMWGICGGPMASRIIENVEDESREMGSSVMTEFIYLGSTIGMALFAMLFILGSGSGNINFEDLPPDVFIDGFILASIVGVILTAVAVILSLIVKEPKGSKV